MLRFANLSMVLVQFDETMSLIIFTVAPSRVGRIVPNNLREVVIGNNNNNNNNNSNIVKKKTEKQVTLVFLTTNNE